MVLIKKNTTHVHWVRLELRSWLKLGYNVDDRKSATFFKRVPF